MRRLFGLSVCVCSVACGRYAFDPVSTVERMDASGSDSDLVDAVAICDLAVPSAIHHYPFDGDASDSIATANGTPVGGPSFQPGRFGLATTLDGTDDVIRIPNFLVLDYTVAFWVRTTAIAPGLPTDWWFNGVGMFDGDMCGNPPNGDWGVAMIAGGRVAGGFAGPSTIMINDGVWHSVAMTRSGPLDLQEVFVDGVLQGMADANSDGLIHSDQPWIGVGVSPCSAGSGPFFAGSIDDLRIYDRVLPSNEVAALATCTP